MVTFLPVWLACTLSFILGLPSLGSAVAFSAATSIATIGLYISYGTQSDSLNTLPLSTNYFIIGFPIALRVIYADRFVRGPFHLGKFSYPISIVAVLWIGFISIVFCLPELNPVNSRTLNYAPVAVGIVVAYALGFWAISARRWFTGPIRQIAGAPPVLYSMFVGWVSADDKRSACTEEEMGIGVAEPVVMLEKAEFLEKGSGA